MIEWRSIGPFPGRTAPSCATRRDVLRRIASAAGVTEMTFFRHFPSKEAVVLTDPYDPAIAEGVRGRPVGEAPLARAARGLRDVFEQLPEDEVQLARRRILLIARTPELRAAVARQNAETERAIAEALLHGGAEALAAHVSAAAVVAALTAALYVWAEQDEHSLRACIGEALATLERQHG